MYKPDKSFYQQLALKMECVGSFAGLLAHDMNNILSGVVGYASFIKMKTNPQNPMYNDVGMIEKSAERAVELTNSLMTLSPERCVVKESVDINQVINAVAGMLATVKKEQVRINLDLDPRVSELTGDRMHLTKSISALAVNGLDAMGDKGGMLDIKTKFGIPDEGDKSLLLRVSRFPCICITVSDEGRGMKPELLAKIFLPFFSTRVPRKGSGLSLAMVYAVTAVHGGDILVETEEGKGTTFKLFLPAKPA